MKNDDGGLDLGSEMKGLASIVIPEGALFFAGMRGLEEVWGGMGDTGR